MNSTGLGDGTYVIDYNGKAAAAGLGAAAGNVLVVWFLV